MSFDKSVNFILEAEGVYSNDPRDPGGETKYGISKRAYPNEDIRSLTRDRAISIYKRDYWDAICGGALPPRLAACVFNSAVNNGVETAIKILQRALRVVDDGDLGPVTLKAIRSGNESDIIEKFLQGQLWFYIQLPTWRTYGAGWVRRQFRLAMFIGEL